MNAKIVLPVLILSIVGLGASAYSVLRPKAAPTADEGTAFVPPPTIAESTIPAAAEPTTHAPAETFASASADGELRERVDELESQLASAMIEAEEAAQRATDSENLRTAAERELLAAQTELQNRPAPSSAATDITEENRKLKHAVTMLGKSLREASAWRAAHTEQQDQVLVAVP